MTARIRVMNSRSVRGAIVPSVTVTKTGSPGRDRPRSGLPSPRWTQLIVTANQLDLGRDQAGLAEGDGEADTPLLQLHVLSMQGAVGVLVDAQQAEEGKQARAPVARAGERRDLHVRIEGAEIGQCDAVLRVRDVGVCVVVVEACAETTVQGRAWKLWMTETLREVDEGRHEAADGGDFVVASVGCDDQTELLFGQGLPRVDAQADAQLCEQTLVCRIRPLGVAPERQICEELHYVPMICWLYTTETEHSIEERGG